jgi:Protein of unknown function (DUF4232)
MRTRTTRCRYAAAAVACCTALLLSAAVAVAAAPARGTPTSAASTCSAANTQVWLGLGGGGGYAGGVAVPLEFSNVGHRTCTLNGYPVVSAYRDGFKQVGPAAARGKQAHAVVTLAPGGTAHAVLTITDWGAVCGSPVTADGLKVYPPGQQASKPIDFSFQVCAHRAVLGIGPVRAGVGIPGYITQ